MGFFYELFAVDTAVLGRVTAVEKVDLPEAVAGCFRDNSAPSEELDGYDVLIPGWVLGRRSPVSCLRIVDPSISRMVR